jgi:LPS-assembly lipoprotein
MSSPDTKTRRRLLALIVALPLLAGCSFQPLYGNAPVGTGTGFAYAEPTNRLEQIIYQELAFRLGRSDSPSAHLISVSASQSNRRVGRTSPGSVLTAYEAKVTASVSVKTSDNEPEILKSFSSFAAASYEISGQVAADNAASADAGEKAARAVADSLRLILVAAHNKGDI